MERIRSVLARHRKLAVAIAGAVVLGVGNYFGADSEAYNLVVALATALGVYAAPNTTS